jgi:xanthosine utilization system XapX-like protein
MPMAVAWFSPDSHESIKHIHGELSETCKTEQKANVIAVEKAKNWVDQQLID